MTLARRLVAEALGSAFLLAVVVGSGIMGERLSQGLVGLALLANAVATGAGLLALIWVWGPVSGAHFNPVVTLAMVMTGQQVKSECLPYALAQVLGAVLGVVAAHAMFGEALMAWSQHARSGPAQWWSEFVATFGLLMVILGCAHSPRVVPMAVAAYITAAYWFTASTSFANPAVTLARTLTDSFAGIAPSDAPAFILAQLAGAVCATALMRWVFSAQKN